MRDCKKFCRPNIIKDKSTPGKGEVLILLNKKHTAVMTLKEYERVSKYFELKGKGAEVGDIVLKGNKIISPSDYKSGDEAIGIVYMIPELSGDGKTRYVSLDYMNPYNPVNGAISTYDEETGQDLWPLFGGFVYDSDNASEDIENPNYYTDGSGLYAIDIDGYAYPGIEKLHAAGMEYYPDIPISTDMINITGKTNYAYLASIGNGSYSGPVEASIFKYKLSSNKIPVPYFNNGKLNSAFRAPSYNVPGTSTVVNIMNPLSDLDGRGNTNKILNFIKNSGHDNTITDLSEENSTGYEFPAVMCCNLYNKGQGAGSWYLPAAGELAYIYAHYNKINATRNILGLENMSLDYFWSSTLMGRDSYGRYYAGSIDFGNGGLDRYCVYCNYGCVAVSAF